MLSVNREFYKGVLFVKLKGLFIDGSFSCFEMDSYLSGFKYVIIDIDNVKEIDGVGINYLINYSKMLKVCDGKVFIIKSNSLFLDKFISKIQIIKDRNEVLERI